MKPNSYNSRLKCNKNSPSICFINGSLISELLSSFCADFAAFIKQTKCIEILTCEFTIY